MLENEMIERLPIIMKKIRLGKQEKLFHGSDFSG